jgi:meso-butanediol dehydrogenase/(S,S)-butanediol dehydrogenase/diacetyl reductase
VADLDLGAAIETAQRVEAAGRKSLAVRVDTTDESANDAMVARCVEALGGVDILVAAAGVASARPTQDSASRTARSTSRRRSFAPSST